MMCQTNKDCWDKAEIFGGIVGGILIPLAIFFVGLFISSSDKANTQQLAEAQKASSELAAQTENLTNLIEHLSSTNPTQRRIAVEVAGYLASKKQLPVELTPTLTRIATQDENSGTAQAATQAVVSAAEINSTTKAIVQAGFSGVPPRVYFHVPTKDKVINAKIIAEALEKSLSDKKLIVPGVQIISGPNDNELRYFQKTDRDEALSILSKLKELGVTAKPVDLSGTYENSSSIRPRHYEFWYGKNN